jgi:DNA repair exonuclease SbcCD ATPase subunit
VASALEFKRLGLRNFLSFGSEEFVISLTGDFITVVLGENRDTGGEDSRNGVGKSAIIDALCYVLFGKVIRGISNQKLVNKLSQKGQMVVWVEFTKGDFFYRVERTERPASLRFFRKPVDSTEDIKTKEKRKFKFDIAKNKKKDSTGEIIEILGFNITLFEYLVANSSESTEFFRLTEEKQREVVEPLFGFTIMSEKAELLKKERLTRNKELVQSESATEATKQANNRILEQVKDLEAKATAWEKTKTAAIKELSDTITALEAVNVEDEITILKEVAELEKAMGDVRHRIDDMEMRQKARVIAKNQHGRDAERAVTDLANLQTTIDALDKSECPTCHQHWESKPEFREDAESKSHQASQNGEAALSAYEEIEKEIDQWQPFIEGEHGNQTVIEATMAEYANATLTYTTVEEAASAGATLSALKSQLITVDADTNPHTDSIAGLKTDAIKVVKEEEVQELRRIIRHYNYLIELLTKKDSFLRKLIIDRWLPILNRRISHWLNILELPHQVTFHPNLSITIMLYHEEFDYGNLSKGERTRLRVALNFAFQDVFEFMNYSINLLAVDELIDSGICPRGAENAVTALRMTSASKNKRVFLITHRDDIAARVDDVMTVIKENNISRIEHDSILHDG